MTMVRHHRVSPPPEPVSHRSGIDLVSLAVLFVAVVAIALVLLAVATHDSSPYFVIPPMLLGCWAILTLRK